MTNDVFTEDDLLGRRDLSLGGITQHHKPRPVPLFKHRSLTFRKPRTQDKYPEDYGLHEKCVKFDTCVNV